jgi:hypothetical protein
MTDQTYTLNNLARLGPKTDTRQLILLKNKSYSLDNEHFSFIEQFENNKVRVTQDVLKSKFFQYLLDKKIIVLMTSDIKKRTPLKNALSLIKKIILLRIYIRVPKSTNKIMLSLVTKTISVAMLITALLSILFDASLSDLKLQNIDFKYFEIHWYIPYIVGIVLATLHELITAFWLYKAGGVIDRFYVRASFLIFISVGSGKSSIYLLNKKQRVHIILMTLLQISSVPIIAITLSLINSDYDIKMFSESVALVSAIMIIASMYPFLLRGDGYLLFQELTNVYGIRQKFFESIKRLGGKNEAPLSYDYSQYIVFIWGGLFIFSIITVITLALFGIQILP